MKGLILFFTALMILSFSGSAEAQNMVSNPGFEQDFTDWAVNHYPYGDESTGIEEIVSGSECENDKCLKLSHGDSTWQGASQIIGNLQPGHIYLFSVRFKTAPTHYAYINIYDRSWRNSSCSVIRKSHTKARQGTGQWETFDYYFVAPENDECGSTSGHDWQVYLYSYHPYEDTNPVYYDDIYFSEVSLSPQTVYSELEESPDWITTCQYFSDGYPLTTCPGLLNHDYADKVSGSHSLRLTGNREKRETLSMDLPVKPDQLYRISFSLKIKDRVVYNYLNLNYPSSWVDDQPDWRNAVELTHGIWSGRYDISVDESSVIPPQIKDSEYRSPSDIGWWQDDSYFRTSPGQATANLEIMLSGYEGELLIDDLRVEEADSLIESKYLHMDIPEYAGMRIEAFSSSPLFVQTNAFRFSFSSDRITVTRDGETTSEFVFPSNFLSGLSGLLENGNVYLSNSNIELSIGGDSVLLAKLKQIATVSVRGPRPGYVAYEAGTIFVTDYKKGVYFSPVRSQTEVLSMPYRFDAQYKIRSYHDDDFEAQGIKFWDLVYDFDQPTYRVDYDIEPGGGFTAQMMPPKEFDPVKYCKERFHTMDGNVNRFPDADYSYMLERVSENINIPLIWMTSYAYSENDLNPPEYYCRNSSGGFVHCSEPGATQYPVRMKFDVTGPYEVGEKQALRDLVDMVHSQGKRIILYMSPKFYYTTNVDEFINDVDYLVTDYNVDGVYFDGMYNADILKTIELARKTRGLLGDKIYVQHASKLLENILYSNTGRNPAVDAWADILYVGEGQKHIDDDIWKLTYCGRNVSNTITTLLAENRLVDYTQSAQWNVENSLSPEEQCDRSLACKGIFRTSPSSEESYTHDSNFQTSIYFETDYFTDQLNSYCLQYTCGDGVCDVGERIHTCPEDCAPVRSSSFMRRDSGMASCQGPESLSQWIINNEPFYNLHYTFDEHPARDESGYKNSIQYNFGVTIEAPSPATVDSREVFEFDGTGRLFGDGDETLDMTGKDFSSMAAIRTGYIGSGLQTIFSLNQDKNFYYGIQDGKAIIYAMNGDLQYGTEEIVSSGCYSGKCLKTQKNDASWQGTSQVVSSLVPGGTYRLSAMFRTTPARRGDISVHDATCGKHYRTNTVYGNNNWELLTKEFTVPITDECGSTSGRTWRVYLYSYSTGDNAELYYDSASLERIDQPSGNMLTNTGFEDDFTGWSHSSYIGPATISGTSNVNDNQWHTVGVVYDRPMMKLYVDGVKENEMYINMYDFERLGKYGIGTRMHGASYDNYHGYIDDLFLTDRALTDQQVMQYHTTLHRDLTIPASSISCVLSDNGETYSPVSWCDINGVCEEFEDDGSCPEDCPYHPADQDRNHCIEIEDLMYYGGEWKYDSTANPMHVLFKAITRWKYDLYCS